MIRLPTTIGLCAYLSACHIQPHPIRLPIVPEEASHLRHQRESVMIVNIDKSGVKSANNRKVESNEDLLNILAEAISSNPSTGIGIRADARAPYESIINVMFFARTAGISRVYLIAGEFSNYQTGEISKVENSLELTIK